MEHIKLGDVFCSKCNAVSPDCVECRKQLMPSVSAMILTSCRGYYQIFKQLEPIQIRLNSDEMTSMSEDELVRKIDESSMYFGPMIVNGAFACEMALKYLIAKEGRLAHGHSLKILFDDLPKCDKSTLYSLLVKNGHQQNENSVDKQIELLSNHFVRWRYSYEYMPACNNFFNSFVHTVCDYVISI